MRNQVYQNGFKFWFLMFMLIIYRACVSSMYQGHRSATEGILRSRSFRKAQMTMPTAIKKNSQCLQLIYQVVSFNWHSEKSMF